jgi:tRNA(Ile)-lysidine synthase
MHSLEKHTLETIREFGLLQAGGPVVVGVSGGPDSMALLHVLATLAGELEISLRAVYVDHSLRPDETAAEADLVREASAGLGIEFRSGKVATREYAREQGLSIEAAARQLRYDLFEEAAEAAGKAVIAVGHTADDQAEEVLLRLIRGAGRSGLAGMAHRNYRGVIRPFLKIPKAVLLDYLNESSIPFLEDSSNQERDFLRNRVRLDLLPHLEKHFNPAIRETLRRTAEVLGSEDELLDDLAADFFRQAVSGEEEQPLRVDIDPLLDAHLSLQRRVVEMVLLQLEAQPSFQQIDKILALAGQGENGKELHLPGGLRLVRREGSLEFSYPAGHSGHRQSLAASQERSFEEKIEGTGRWPIQGTEMVLQIEILEQAPGREELLAMEADFLEMTELDFPLTVRSPRPGDRFHPLGGPGSRKVADFLADRKVPREQRCLVPVLENEAGIIALLGQRIDHRYRLVAKDAKVLKVLLLSR